MLFRSYRYCLKLNKEQEKTFRNLLKYVFVVYRELSPHFEREKHLTIEQLRTFSAPLFEKYAFSPLFTETIYPQILVNLKEKNAHLGDAFPLSFKEFSYNRYWNTVSLPFCKDIRLSHKRALPSKIYKVDLYFKNKKWFVNLLVAKKGASPKEKELKVVGIDVGLKEFATLSNGEIIENPRFYEQLKTKISIEQKKLSKKKINSRNWLEQKEKISNLYSKLHRQRIDFLHKLTHRLSEQYDVIGLESINIRDLQKKKHLRNSLSDVSWGEFMELLKYKCEEKGKRLIFVERYFPSSQLCSECGNRQFMPVHLRTYSCSRCKCEIDRDYNASINIENRTKEIYLNKYHRRTNA